MIRYLLIAAITFPGILNASDIDSLFRVWQDNTLSDSVRADAFYDHIIHGAFNTDPDSALILARELLQFSTAADLNVLTVDAWKLIGYILFRMGNYPEALSSYREGLKLAERIKDKHGTASILLRTGFVYHDNDNLVQALKYYERSQQLFEELGDTSGLSSVFNEFGSIYRSRGEYEKALEYYQKGLQFHEDLNQGKSSAAMLLNIGLLYLNQENYDQASDHIQRALSLDREKGDKLGIASGLAAMGSVFLEQEKFPQALEQLEQSLEISREIKDIQGASATLLTLCEYYLDEGKFLIATKYAKESLGLSQSLGDLGGQQAACENLYWIYKELKNWQQSLYYHEQMLRFEDSIQSEATSSKLQQMAFARQIMADSLAQVEKDLKIEIAHQEEVRKKDKNRNIVLGGGLFFLLLSVGLYSRWNYVKKSKAIIEKEKERSENLLLNILPAEIAEELKINGHAAARDFDLVSILFTDFKGFTEKSAQLSAAELLEELNHCFKEFDLICEKYQIEKIKTIGDAYMAAGGLPLPAADAASRTVLAALEMQDYIQGRHRMQSEKNKVGFQMRVGIHTGPVVAGIVGVKKFQYDIWGDTVNTAARMETAGEIGKVNISQDTYEAIVNDTQFEFTSRGMISVKGKGSLQMWFVALRSS